MMKFTELLACAVKVARFVSDDSIRRATATKRVRIKDLLALLF